MQIYFKCLYFYSFFPVSRFYFSWLFWPLWKSDFSRSSKWVMSLSSREKNVMILGPLGRLDCRSQNRLNSESYKQIVVKFIGRKETVLGSKKKQSKLTTGVFKILTMPPNFSKMKVFSPKFCICSRTKIF